MVGITTGTQSFLFTIADNGKATPRTEQILITAASGYGKTILSERTIESYIEAGYKVIYVCDSKNNFEAGFSQFRPTDRLHLKKLEQQGEMNLITTYNAKIFHPLTIIKRERPPKDCGIPRGVLPPLNFFTIPISSIDDDCISYLFEDTKKGNAFLLMQEAITKLKPKDDFYDFTRIIQQLAESKYKEVGSKKVYTDTDPTNLFPEISKDKRYMQTIKSILNEFQRHQFLTEETHELNLDLKKELRDKKSITVISARWIPESRLRLFVTLWIMKQIESLAKELGIKLLVVFPELRKIFPKDGNKSVSIAARCFTSFLSTVRTENISTLADTQVLSDCQPEIIDSFTYQILGGNKSISETKIYAEWRLAKEWIEWCKSANRGEFIIVGKTDEGPFKTCFPTHAHKEYGESYLKKFREIYPEKMLKYAELVDERRLEVKERINTLKEINSKKKAREMELAEKIKEVKTRERNPQAKKEKIEDIIKIYRLATRKEVHAKIEELLLTANENTHQAKYSYRQIMNIMLKKHGAVTSLGLIAGCKKRLWHKQQAEKLKKEKNDQNNNGDQTQEDKDSETRNSNNQIQTENREEVPETNENDSASESEQTRETSESNDQETRDETDQEVSDELNILGKARQRTFFDVQ